MVVPTTEFAELVTDLSDSQRLKVLRLIKISLTRPEARSVLRIAARAASIWTIPSRRWRGAYHTEALHRQICNVGGLSADGMRWKMSPDAALRGSKAERRDLTSRIQRAARRLRSRTATSVILTHVAGNER